MVTGKYQLRLPKRTEDLFRAAEGSRHPGLLLDKYTAPVEQKLAANSIDAVIKASDSKANQALNAALETALARRQDWLSRTPGIQLLRATTSSRLTLHLARAAALENVGICMHPLYGFVYLPGTGLKGMAHAFACESWFDTSTPPETPQDQWHTICRIFGTADSPMLRDIAKRLGVALPAGEAAGSVVFHDAWPVKVPKLIRDLTNNHHTNYYGDGSTKPGQSVPPPNDAEPPIPINFLAIGADNEFVFAIAPRRAATPSDDLNLAASWLAGALQFLGCGAKTNAGYGYFQVGAKSKDVIGSAEPITRTAATRKLTADITLLTPAFLAGANQHHTSDCQLRVGTLRGQLRWWWRTLHASYLSPSDLKRLEAAIWGDANSGSPIAMRLEATLESDAASYDKKEIAQNHQIPRPGGAREIQGLFYLSYGMDDDRDKGTRRCYMPVGARWTLHITARRSKYQPGIHLSADDVLEQATDALWLLGEYGGVGARSRKGFGSLQINIANSPPRPLDASLERAKLLRTKCSFADGTPIPGSSEPACSAFQLGGVPKRLFAECTISAKDEWHALDTIGQAYQSAVKDCMPKGQRAALGLPRKGLSDNRYASPVHISLSPTEEKKYRVRLLAFPQQISGFKSPTRPILENFVQAVEKGLNNSEKPNNNANGPAKRVPQAGFTNRRRSDQPGSRKGTEVHVKIVERREKGGYKVEEEDDEDRKGVLTGNEAPNDLAIGSTHVVKIKDDGPNNRQYSWLKTPQPPKIGKN